MSQEQPKLTEQQEQDIRRNARNFMRRMGFNVPEDAPPITVIVEDDDGKEIERRIVK